MLFQVSAPEPSEGHVLLACRGKDLSHFLGKQVRPAASISASKIISLVMMVKVGQRGPSGIFPLPSYLANRLDEQWCVRVEAGTDWKDSRGREGKHMVMFSY